MDITTRTILTDLDFAAKMDSGVQLSREACAHLSDLIRKFFSVPEAQVLPLMGNVEEDKGTNFTVAKITGPTRESLEKAAEGYLRDFSPMGYSTRILVSPHQEGGIWQMKMSRYTSCE